MATCNDCVHVEACNGILNGFDIDIEFFGEQVSVCKNFKDRSRFVELPCKVGDLVYIIKKARGLSVRGAKVNSITITESGKIQVSCYRSSFIGLWSDDAFATKEEAMRR